MWFARVRYVSTAKYVSTAVQTAGTEKDFVVWGIDRQASGIFLLVQET